MGAGPSDREDAEVWSFALRLGEEQVLHCEGDSQAPLYSLIHEISAAHGRPVSLPTYLLIDRHGVVHALYEGFPLNDVQQVLADSTGRPLDRDWSPVVGTRLDLGELGYPMRVRARAADGTLIDETLGWSSDSDILRADNDSVVLDTGSGFDLDTPVEVSFAADALPHDAAYRVERMVNVHFERVPDFASTLTATAAVTFADDGGLTFTAPPRRSLMGAPPPTPELDSYPFLVFGSPLRATTPFTSSEALIEDVWETLGSRGRRAVLLLRGVQVALRIDRPTLAARRAEAAASELARVGADPYVQYNANSLAEAVGSLSFDEV